MKRLAFVIVLALFASGISCGNKQTQTKESLVLIKTEFGEIKVKLYDDTPEHKQNFLKLAEEGFYNDLLFHRVIKNFMIQGGDPESKNAKPGVLVGGGSPGYTVPAEFRPNHFHKKGALAAARMGGPRNPEKRSSGSQFYIVQGEIFTPGALDTMQININSQKRKALLNEHLAASNAEFEKCKQLNDRDGFNLLYAEIREKADSIYESGPQYKMSEEQINAYTTIGGYPSLDTEYTVFGEVVEGLDVIDKIAAVQTDGRNRPVEDVRMKVEVLK